MPQRHVGGVEVWLHSFLTLIPDGGEYKHHDINKYFTKVQIKNIRSVIDLLDQTYLEQVTGLMSFP